MNINLYSPITRASIVVVMGVAVAGICLAGREPGVGAGKDVEAGLRLELPGRVGEWYGTTGEVSRSEKEILPEDTEFAKMDYRRQGRSGAVGGSDHVHCSIVLSGRDRTSIHRPEVCLVGQGWNIDASSERKISLRNDVDLSVRCLELSRGSEEGSDGMLVRGLYYYWFVGSDATTADHLERILLTAKANVIDNRNPRWAYVSVLAGIPLANGQAEAAADGNTQSFEQTAAMLENFVARVTPEFQTAFAPVEIF